MDGSYEVDFMLKLASGAEVAEPVDAHRSERCEH